MSKFKIELYIVFSVFIVLAVIIFASSKSSSSGPVAHITVWGFLSSNDFDTFFQGTSIANSKTLTVTYVAENPTTFQSDFVNALANGLVQTW